MCRLLVLAMAALVGLGSVSAAEAQSWSKGRSRPALYEIISVDPSGTDGWPYGQDDPADDGVATLEDDEASIDLRTLYADADSGRAFLRAYVAGREPPVASAIAFFFIDSDDNRLSGGPARDTGIFRAFTLDPTAGGYEHAIGIDGGGNVVGSYEYASATDEWLPQNVNGNDLEVEVGADRDPIELGNQLRGYFQIDVAHRVTGLDADCQARVFVRLHNDDAPDRDFGDDDDVDDRDDDPVASCRPRLNDLGDPDVLRTDACRRDADCPAGGRCDGGVCFFSYACEDTTDCRSGQVCEGGRCVLVIDGSCDGDSDCDGLVCDSGACVACTGTGASACAAGRVCSAVGRCVDAADVMGGDGDADGEGMLEVDGDVRGGAFKCALSRGGADGPFGVLFALAASVSVSIAWRHGLRRRRRRSDDCGRASSGPGGQR